MHFSLWVYLMAEENGGSLLRGPPSPVESAIVSNKYLQKSFDGVSSFIYDEQKGSLDIFFQMIVG